MSDAPFMISPAGFIVDASINGMPQGYGTVGLQSPLASGETPNVADPPTPGPWIVTQLLPGGVVQLTGSGRYQLLSTARSPQQAIGSGSSPQLGGTMGALQADFVTGAAGTAQGLQFLVNANQVGAYLGFSLDMTNRPTFTITDQYAVVQAVGAPSGAAIPSGTPLQLRLFWDATGSILPSYVVFYINGVNQALGTVTGPWSPFQPTSVLFGANAVFGSFSAFTGRFNKAQASNSPYPTTSPLIPSASTTPP